MKVVDLLTYSKHNVLERRKVAGLESGDVLEARLMPRENEFLFSDPVAVHPHGARKSILKAAKRFRKSTNGNGQLEFIHRVSRLSNKCERYGHIDPRKIFEELTA